MPTLSEGELQLTMLSDTLYFADTPKHRGHHLALWFVSRAFRHGKEHMDNLHKLIQDTKSVQASFMMSPTVGLTLMRCIQMNRRDVIICILSEGASVNMMFRGRTLLHEAVKAQNKPMLQFILSLEGIEKDKCDEHYKTPLMEAALGKPKCLEILLEAGCDLNARDPSGNSVLHQTLFAHHARREDVLECLDILLQHGADINIRGQRGKTCLIQAIEMENHWLIQWLILHNCDVNLGVVSARLAMGTFQVTKFQNASPLVFAFQKADRVLVEVLVACGCKYKQYRKVLDICKSYQMLHSSLLKVFSNVDPLQALCRNVIRSRLTTKIGEESKRLGLPQSLQRFLLCEDELSALD